MTKSWLKNNNVAFIEKNVSEEGVADELMGLGYKVTPVIMINGTDEEVYETGVVGYSPKKLEAALRQ